MPPSTMPFFTVDPLWAWCFDANTKRLDNRSWITHYRGPVGLHASSKRSPAGYRRVVDWLVERGLARRTGDASPAVAELPEVPPLDDLPRGCLVGRGVLTRVVFTTANLHGFEHFDPDAACVHCGAVFSRAAKGHCPKPDPWAMPEMFGFQVDGYERLPLLPTLGHERFWYPTCDLCRSHTTRLDARATHFSRDDNPAHPQRLACATSARPLDLFLPLVPETWAALEDAGAAVQRSATA